MREFSSDHKYIAGQNVYAKTNPSEKLIVRRYYHRIYYCRSTDGTEKEYAYFESEISPFV